MDLCRNERGKLGLGSRSLVVSAVAVEGRAEAEAIIRPIGGQVSGVLGLEQGEAILEGVEVRLADEGPARPVIRLRVWFPRDSGPSGEGESAAGTDGRRSFFRCARTSAVASGLANRESRRPRASRSWPHPGPGPASQSFTVPSRRPWRAGRVPADGDSPDRGGVAPEGQDLLAGRHVPELRRLVRGGREQPPPIGAEGDHRTAAAWP